MSTMLKTAAMSLLSKTLQTFLYKYLLDVDVEGVAMPSFMDVDGHSGWGVRLCNVRLREGVELMTLPGKRTVKRPKPKEDISEEEEAVNEEEPVVNGETDEPQAEATQSLDASREEEEANVEVTDRRTMNMDYYTSDEGESDISDGAYSPSRARRVFSCFSREPKEAAKTAARQAVESRKVSTTEQQPLLPDAETESTRELNEPSSHAEVSGKPAEPELVEDDEEEFIDVEKDMVLRLGNGGRIGVLDVRLVGKELHVSVEDAFLVVEACQKPDEPEKDADAEKPTEAAKSDEAKESTADKKSTSKKADMSAGERVLDNSVIARALSAIPHLFLRDVRVRLVVREGDVTAETQEEISEQDSVVEFGIELLSVTSGEDFLAHVRAEEEAAFPDEAYHRNMNSFASFDDSSNNEFIAKRIRTGRGPEGGIWLKVFPPRRLGVCRSPKAIKDDDSECQWARDRWTTNVQFCFFRCSGLDIVSRIYVGKQEEESNEYFFYDELTLDTMLVGVDYVAPGPAPSLPPLEKNGDQAALDAMRAMSEAEAYVTDKNGIQSVTLDSAFHRLARGLKPTVCKAGHLPCETCPLCWKGDDTSGGPRDHPLDSSTPLAGVVFNLSLNDPLEVNVDRSSLEVFGQLQSLFLKKATVTETDNPVEEAEPEGDVSSTSMHGASFCMPAPRRKSTPDIDVSDAFPPYMQPENIEIIGLHLAKIVVRIHAMRSDGVYDGGLTFCYWQAETRCITLDIQKLTSEKKLLDARVDVGEFTTVEYKGTGSSQFVSLGLPYPEISSSDSTSSHQASSGCTRPPWPSTAYKLLGIPVPLETAHYECRERHALQLRYVDLSGDTAEEERSVVDVRLGVASVEMPFKTKDAIMSVIGESSNSVFGTPDDAQQEPNDKPVTETPTKAEDKVLSKDSLMKCKVRIDGGVVNVYPVINLCLPPSTFFVESSSLHGLFFETMLQRVELSYGERAKPPKPRRGSLVRMAALPESVRLRILLFVNDLGPLETALGLKHESNSFLRYRGVNRAIVKVAKRSSKLRRKKSKSRMPADRREEMLAELLSMDDASLQDLWALHQRRPKGVASKRKPV